MPKIAELRDIDGALWVRIGVLGDFPSGVSLWTPQERERFRSDILRLAAYHIEQAELDGCAEFRGRVADEIREL